MEITSGNASSVIYRHHKETLDLLPGHVHVFCLLLHSFLPVIDNALWILSEDERARARRFRFETDRRRFILARVLLRHLLAGYLATDPTEISFTYGRYGKPGLDLQSGPHLHFNLSHSADVATFAFSREHRLGIDVEVSKPPTSWRSLAPLVLSPREQLCLAKFPEHQQPEIFLQTWTRKEAYVKGRGEGLARCLSEFDVPLGPLTKAEPVGDIRECTPSWYVLPITPVPGYHMGLAVESRQGSGDTSLSAVDLSSEP